MPTAVGVAMPRCESTGAQAGWEHAHTLPAHTPGDPGGPLPTCSGFLLASTEDTAQRVLGLQTDGGNLGEEACLPTTGTHQAAALPPVRWLSYTSRDGVWENSGG